MTKPTCATCAFWTTTNECRRHAPLVTGGLHTPTSTEWPSVNPTDWCGDHELAGGTAAEHAHEPMCRCVECLGF